MNCLKCDKCGKFIKNRDLEKCKFKEIWNKSASEPDLDCVIYWCLKCEPLTKERGK